MKRCTKCGERKHYSQFHRQGARGRHSACSACRLPAIKRWQRNNRVRAMLYAAKVRAGKAHVPFTLTVDDVCIPELCPVLGLKLIRSAGRPRDNSPTLDRLNPTLGYTPENTVVMSHKANRIKNDATLDELERVATFMRSRPCPASR